MTTPKLLLMALENEEAALQKDLRPLSIHQRLLEKAALRLSKRRATLYSRQSDLTTRLHEVQRLRHEVSNLFKEGASDDS
jgi:hypothetical protein